MARLTDAQKRGFARKVMEIINDNSAELLANGYDPANKLVELGNQATSSEVSEAQQESAQAAAKDATEKAQNTLRDWYDNASQCINIFEGLLGKDSHLVEELRKIRPAMNR